MVYGPQRLFSTSMRDTDSYRYNDGVHDLFVALETERLCKFVSLVMLVRGDWRAL